MGNKIKMNFKDYILWMWNEAGLSASAKLSVANSCKILQTSQ